MRYKLKNVTFNFRQNTKSYDDETQNSDFEWSQNTADPDDDVFLVPGAEVPEPLIISGPGNEYAVVVYSGKGKGGKHAISSPHDFKTAGSYQSNVPHDTESGCCNIGGNDSPNRPGSVSSNTSDKSTLVRIKKVQYFGDRWTTVHLLHNSYRNGSYRVAVDMDYENHFIFLKITHHFSPSQRRFLTPQKEEKLNKILEVTSGLVPFPITTSTRYNL